MARCPKCRKTLKLTLEKVTDTFYCESCNSGPLKISRASGYFFAFGLAAYFIFGMFFAVVILGIEPDDLMFYTHNAASEGTFAGIVFLIGFLIWVKYWISLWARKFAKLY